MTRHYYNEWNPYAAEWLENLIRAKLLPAGDVDRRSIDEVQKNDLKGYTQCHFFAGIGGWSVALRLAGWPITKPIWTGSCPCQPYSSAGEGQGQEDPRHKWPIWFRLIKKCRPPVVAGEQVERAIKFGWLDGVYADMEDAGYALGSFVVPGCVVNAPHKRDRIYFIAEESMADGANENGERGSSKIKRPSRRSVVDDRWMSGKSGASRSLDNAVESRPQRLLRNDRGTQGRKEPSRSTPSAGFWDSDQFILCGDEKYRRIPEAESGICPVDNGLSKRVVLGGAGKAVREEQARTGIIEGLGNAIIPPLAAEFIRTYMECRP